MRKFIILGLALFGGVIFPSTLFAALAPVLEHSVNDFAGMMPKPSIENLAERLERFKAQTGYTIVVLTLKGLEGDDLERFGREAYQNLPLQEKDRRKSVLLIVALTERKVGLRTGAEARLLFPEPAASETLRAHVDLYLDGYRKDLGIHSGVDYIFRTIKGEVRVGSTTETEELQARSISGGAAGAILALFLAPFLAFMAGGLWGVYATKFGLVREIRLFMGAILAIGTAKAVAILMGWISGFSEGLWYFLLLVSIPLGAFGSLTEFWMSGEWSDWSGIPRVKDPRPRKPEDNMGI